MFASKLRTCGVLVFWREDYLESLQGLSQVGEDIPVTGLSCLAALRDLLAAAAELPTSEHSTVAPAS
ncbi:unnamed protein product [Lathyrus sativus]|nr:unnamed protein product [Lathyrus sativus]